MPHTDTTRPDTPQLKVLVATRLTQGQRPNDFSFTQDGELVYLGVICDSDRKDPDSHCGCSRSFSGVTTRMGTTTAVVAEVAMTRQQYLDTLRTCYEATGMLALIGKQEVTYRANRLLTEAEARPVGTVVEYRHYEIADRTPAGQVPSA